MFGKENKDKRGNNRNKIIKLGRRIYDVAVPSDVLKRIEEKQKRTITAEQFQVRGHWRTYQSGKRIWIAQYIKGDKSKEIVAKQKTYHL